MNSVETRLMAYIAPRAPCCDGQREAFANAVLVQSNFEQTEAAQQAASMPRGISGFTVNGFSAQLGAGLAAREASLFPAGLCPDARAILLLAGLLYRGVSAC